MLKSKFHLKSRESLIMWKLLPPQFSTSVRLGWCRLHFRVKNILNQIVQLMSQQKEEEISLVCIKSHVILFELR